MNEAATEGYFPPPGDDGWEWVTPTEAGWDEALLESAVTYAGERNSSGFIVLQGGLILAERYWGAGGRDVKADVASAQKSVTSVLVGIARQAGLIDISAPSSTVLGQGWSRASRDHEDRISLVHHLSMTTGLTEELTVEAEPGAAWAYNNRTYHIIKNGLERVAGRPLDEWSREVLWAPIGMKDTSWVARTPPPGAPRNMFAFGPEDAPYSALVTTIRDMARFGLLMANRGRWGDALILADEEYLRTSVTASQALNQAYGYLWWLNTPGSYMLPIRQAMGDGPFIPAAPADLFCALGAGDQKIYITRTLDLVVARQGTAAGEPGAARSTLDNDLWARLMAAAPGRTR